MFSTRWLAWQVVASQYILEGYSISDNLAQATLQVYEFRKVLITYYIKVSIFEVKLFQIKILIKRFNIFQSIIYYTIRSPKFNTWLSSLAIEEALQATQDRSFVDLDPIFNHNLDEDFDFRASGITRSSFCSVYMDWIQFCYEKRMENDIQKQTEPQTLKPSSQSQSQQLNQSDCSDGISMKGISPNPSNNQTPSPRTSKFDKKDGNKSQTQPDDIVSLREIKIS